MKRYAYNLAMILFLRERLPHYAELMRLNKPIGILLLAWPILWAFLLVDHGFHPDRTFFIFMAGVILMRSAGCILNDFADRHIDPHVKRTQNRPLASGKISSDKALLLAALLALTAFLLILKYNALTILLAILGALLAFVYPFMKRITHLPQLGLGIAFSWGVLMVFAAKKGEVSALALLLFFTSLLWPLIYDTFYAMTDKEDDLKIGVKSTAILFNTWDRVLIVFLQITFLLMLFIVGASFHLRGFFNLSLVMVALLFCYQQWLIKDRDPKKCFAAFLNNNWVGALIFIGILSSHYA